MLVRTTLNIVEQNNKFEKIEQKKIKPERNIQYIM